MKQQEIDVQEPAQACAQALPECLEAGREFRRGSSGQDVPERATAEAIVHGENASAANEHVSPWMPRTLESPLLGAWPDFALRGNFQEG